jgi:hypothetical protein
MKEFKVVLCIFLMGVSSCAGSRKTAVDQEAGTQTEKKQKLACADVSKGISGVQLAWKTEENSVLNSLTNKAKPTSYKVYSLDSLQLGNFFREARSKGNVSTVLPLPDPAGCRLCRLTESGVMPEELKKKYPDVVSLKGSDAEGADVRLDYDGRKMKGQVIVKGEVYLVNPVRSNDKTYYMVYRKLDSGDPKESFERAPQSSGQQIKYDR